MTEPAIVNPAQILANAQASATTARLADKLRVQISPPGTAPAKVRLGYVTAFDPSTWTCTALIGDLVTPIPNIPVLGHLYPAVESAAMFVQTGGDSTTEYTCIGTMPKDPGTPTYGQTWRIRKPAFQSISNAGPSLNPDTDLLFYGQAGRTYLFEMMLLVEQNSTFDMDVIVGWIMPAGTTWSGGAGGPIQSIARSGLAGETTGAGANWRGVSNGVGGLRYGVEIVNTGGTFEWPLTITMHGSLKMGATSGICNVGWCQGTPLTASTRVLEGSYLKVDMTSEYTL